VLIGLGVGLLIGLQFGGTVPGITSQPVEIEDFIKFISAGAAFGFFIGLINLSKVNPNLHKTTAYTACLFTGVIALAINIYHGYIVSSIGLNILALVALGYIPSKVLGGFTASSFSKNA